MSDWTFLNKHRLRVGQMRSDDTYGFNGAFSFAVPGEARRVFCVASDGMGWQHVSVSFGPNRATPSWAVMCAVKELFWEPEDTVIQLHPPRSRWISNHDGCLHLWRCIDGREQPMPPDSMVGLKGVKDGDLSEETATMLQRIANTPGWKVIEIP